MERLAKAVVTHRVAVLLIALAALTAAGMAGGGVAGSLSNGGFEDPEAESVQAAQVLAEEFGAAPPNAVLLVRANGTSVDDATVVSEAADLEAMLGGEQHVTSVNSYWSLGSPPGLRNDTGDAALVFVSFEGDDGEVLDHSRELAENYRGPFGSLDVAVGGTGPLFSEVQETVESDLARSEAIALPVTMILLIIIFGSVVAASLPLGVGVISIIGTFFVLEMLTRFTDVSIFALNLTTGLGLGLAIDYALFVVSRYREELGAGFDPHAAARRTMLTAGRTVLFSAGTVAVSLAAMLVFPLSFLRSFGYAGIAVVGLAAIGAVVVLPALLAVLGHNVDRFRVRRTSRAAEGSGIWHRLATFVMRRPVPIATTVVALLIALGSPFLGVRLAGSDDRVLAPGSPARVVGDALRTEFSAFEAAAIEVVATNQSADEAAQLAAELSALMLVARVDGPGGSHAAGAQVAPPSPLSARFVSDAGYYLSVISDVDPSSEEAERLVAEIRAADPDVVVAGPAADLVDTKAALFGALPWALGIIGTATFVVLFLMFGSLLVPAKAVVLNLLSLSAAFGALVWIFQDGNLSDVLGFTATGSLDLTMPVLMFCIAFGLSMDYEVFLLSRIKEEHDAGGDNEHSVAMGLERTGRIVTAAAVLIAVVFTAFATSSVAFIKMFGVGMTLAVLVDAFLIRATLVPAFMRLAGAANWWAPRWMRRIHDRFGFSETSHLEPGPSMLEPEASPA